MQIYRLVLLEVCKYLHSQFVDNQSWKFTVNLVSYLHVFFKNETLYDPSQSSMPYGPMTVKWANLVKVEWALTIHVYTIFVQKMIYLILIQYWRHHSIIGPMWVVKVSTFTSLVILMPWKCTIYQYTRQIMRSIDIFSIILTI